MKKKHTGAIVFFTVLAGLIAVAIAYFSVMFYVKTGSFIPPVLSDMSGLTGFGIADVKVSDEADSSAVHATGDLSDAKTSDEAVKANITKKPTKKPTQKPKKSGKKKPTTTPVPSKPEDVNDISTHDMKQYLGEMPGEDSDIVSTATSVYTYEQMVKDLYFLDQRYPGIFTYETLGVTKDLRQIYAVTLGNPAAPNHVVIQYTVHSREYINCLLAMKQIEYYLKNYAAGNTYGDRSYPDLFANFCLHVIPMANPDVVSVSELGIDSMRTSSAKGIIQYCWESDTQLGRTAAPIEDYLKTFKANANGVDLNKNFPVGWDGYTDGVPVPSTDCHKGVAPASEVETQAIINLVHANPTVAVISYHSAGDLIYWNYGVEDENLLAADRNLAINLNNVTGYPTAVSEKYNWHLAGGCSDYFMWEEGIPSVTLETGQGTCPLDISAFSSMWNANRDVYALLAAMYG